VSARLLAFPRQRADMFATALALVTALTQPAPANVVPVRHPLALRTARSAIAERARAIGASEDSRERANRIALRELAAGRSTAVAVALAYSELTDRRNPLLRPATT
jgi:hypothetical protein